jgi:hypothetical protein
MEPPVGTAGWLLNRRPLDDHDRQVAHGAVVQIER